MTIRHDTLIHTGKYIWDRVRHDAYLLRENDMYMIKIIVFPSLGQFHQFTPVVSDPTNAITSLDEYLYHLELIRSKGEKP